MYILTYRHTYIYTHTNIHKNICTHIHVVEYYFNLERCTTFVYAVEHYFNCVNICYFFMLYLFNDVCLRKYA